MGYWFLLSLLQLSILLRSTVYMRLVLVLMGLLKAQCKVEFTQYAHESVILGCYRHSVTRNMCF